MKRLKQIFRLKRYFLVAYMYQLDNGTTGQGQMSIKSRNGNYLNVSDLVATQNEKSELELNGKIKEFVLLNVLELNKRDFRYYTEHSNFKESEKL